MTSRSRARSRVTIDDIARHAGVSIGAVSFALNGRKGVSEETRARVLRIADELGWVPSSAARSLSGSRADAVGLVLARDPRTLGVESFYMQFIAGIESELSPRGLALLLQVVPDVEHELSTYHTWGAARRVDGVLLTDPRLDDPRIPVLSEPGALPAVVVGAPAVAGDLPSVWTDDAAGVRESVRYLHALGHLRVARVAGLEHLGHTGIRDEAFAEETDRLGVAGVTVRTDYMPEQGAAATRRLLAGPGRPTAILYDNDVMAVAGLGVAAELGLSVPADLSIVAWDDSPLCRATYPGLTALSHDVVAYGAHAARRLLDRISGEPGGSFLDSAPTLRTRGSTGRPDNPAPA